MAREVTGGGGLPQTPKAGFYSAESQAALGGNMTLAGVLLSGYYQTIRKLLEKAQAGTQQYEHLQAVEREVVKLMNLLNQIPGTGALPKDLASQLTAMVGTGPNDPGVLGKLIDQVQDGPWDQGQSIHGVLEQQLSGIRKILTTGGGLQLIRKTLADIKALQAFWEEMRSSNNPDFFSSNPGYPDNKSGPNLYKFYTLLSNVGQDVQQFNTLIGQYLSQKVHISTSLLDLSIMLTYFWGRILGVSASCGQGSYSCNGGTYENNKGPLGDFWPNIKGSLKGAMPEDQAHFDEWANALLNKGNYPFWENEESLNGLGGYTGGWDPHNTGYGVFTSIEQQLAAIKASDLPSLQDKLQLWHWILNQEESDPNWVVENSDLAAQAQPFRQLIAEVAKLENSAGSAQPDTTAYIKGASDQVNQLLQQLNDFLGQITKQINTSIQLIRPKK